MNNLLTLHVLGLHTQAVFRSARGTKFVLWLLTCCANSYNSSTVADAFRAIGTWRKVATPLVVQEA